MEEKKFILPDIVKEGNFIKVSVDTFEEGFVDTVYYGKVTEVEDDEGIIMIHFDKMVTVMYSRENQLTPSGYAAEFSYDSANCTIMTELANENTVKIEETTEDEMIGLLSEAVNRIIY